jgi:hypothetical protein
MIWRRFDWHFTTPASFLTNCSTGMSTDSSNAKTPVTSNNSISVLARYSRVLSPDEI